MRQITFAQATLEAMKEEMIKDENIFVMGEDIVRQGGIFGQFKGLQAEFGDRVMDMPISETAIIGAAVGAAMAGMRPVADMHFADFMGVAMDELFNQMAKIRYMFGGQTTVPMVVRAPDGMSSCGAAQHSQSIEAWFMNIPGVIVVTPSNPADAKGLLKSALRDNNPVIFFENKILYKEKGEVPEDEYLVTIGKAKVVKEGTDITIISYSIAMKKAYEVAEKLEKEGIHAEVIDLRTLVPYDKEAILESVKKTHRLAIIHEAVKQGGAGSEIAAFVAENALEYLDAPIMRFGAPFTPVPFSPPLEKEYRLDSDKITKEIKEKF
ncbi:MAG: alpha-ketoacid dehydrogenase subunit beta [Sedimentibacter sp.]|uniref:alpha-ketoacid dehydrogenase subunit beta n=1 Tax=Sedimentibacter sp. TaxID=1960295 RepID=UPI002982A22B|nr:alpha-ketoacid dehydrogenase subunit beta [Sedimentibacter sp.]MDW5299233.1 alpha-ketoacid dehydrogenase subunit beta [Sedimentibacter sp.]